MNKRGQLTIFIILAIVLLLMTVFYFLLRSEVNQFEEEDFLPPDVIPIKRSIESCISDISKEGIKMLGQTSGYLYLPEQLKNNPVTHVQLDPFGLMKAPYWQVGQDLYIPPFSLVETQLTQYIDEELDRCLDLEAFSTRFSFEFEERSVTVSLNDDDVSVHVIWPIRVTQKVLSEVTQFESFHVTHPVRLKEMIQFGTEILAGENEENFFENMTMGLMAMHPDVPFSGMITQCGKPPTWELVDVKKDISDMLTLFVPQVQVKNSDHPGFLAEDEVYQAYQNYNAELYEALENEPLGDITTYSDRLEAAKQRVGKPSQELPLDSYAYHHFYLDTGYGDHDMKASFQYDPSWGLGMKVRPSQDGRLSARAVKGARQYLSYLCVHLYHFAYDLYYPVQVALIDEDAFLGEGYQFRYYFPVMIQNNEAHREGFDLTPFFAQEEDVGFCSQVRETVTDIRVYGLDDDGYLGQEIPEVNISLQCLNKYCDLGVTNADEGFYRLKVPLPSTCANPTIIAEKEGYLTNSTQATNLDSVELHLDKINEIPFRVVKHRYYATTGELQPAVPLDDNDQVLLYIQAQGAPYDQHKVYPFEADFEEEQKTMGLLVKDQSYDVTLIYANGDKDFAGGFEGNVTLSQAQVHAASEIVFHVFEYLPTPVLEEEQTELIAYYVSGEYNEALKPTLVLR